MVGLNEKDMAAVIRSYDLKPYYYPTLFPLKETNLLTWKMLEAQSGLKIAADLISRGATIPKKTREAISRIQGDIPKIAVAREKLEDELTEYDIMIAMAGGNPDLRAIVEFWAEDTEFVWNGVAARAEWIALKQISLGKVKFSNMNNAAVITEYDVDYQIPTSQKVGVTSTYNGAAGKPLTKDIPNVIKHGKSLGAKYKFAFMTPATFEKLAGQEEVFKRTSSYIQNLTDVQDTPTVESVNSYMAKKSTLFGGLQFVIVDQDITIELADGSRQSGNPFEEDVVMFSESKVLGNTWWKKPIDLKLVGSPALKVMRGHTLIKKYSDESPVREVTEGISNLFPAWNGAGRCTLMQVDSTSWDK